MQKKMLILQEKISAWTSQIKIACFLLVAFLIYAYLIVVMKTIYYKMKRLDAMEDLTVQTQKMIHELHVLDQKVAIQTEDYEDFYPDY